MDVFAAYIRMTLTLSGIEGLEITREVDLTCAFNYFFASITCTNFIALTSAAFYILCESQEAQNYTIYV